VSTYFIDLYIYYEINKINVVSYITQLLYRYRSITKILTIEMYNLIQISASSTRCETVKGSFLVKTYQKRFLENIF